MKTTNFIELKVEDDGDTTLTLVQHYGSVSRYQTGNLCYALTELEELKAELLSYGCWDEAMIDRNIKEATEGPYNVENIVR
jgi:hypothetical protein